MSRTARHLWALGGGADAAAVAGAEVHVVRRGASVTVAVRGELDFSGVEGVERLLRASPWSPGTEVMVDLAPCGFIDSSVVAMLLRLERDAQAAGAQLTVLVGDGPPRRTLELTGACGHLTVLHDAPAGLRRRAGGRPLPRAFPAGGASE